MADTLRAVEHDAEPLKAQAAALAAADQALQLVQTNYKAELVDYLQVLTADNQYQQDRLGYIQARRCVSRITPHCSSRWAGTGGIGSPKWREVTWLPP